MRGVRKPTQRRERNRLRPRPAARIYVIIGVHGEVKIGLTYNQAVDYSDGRIVYISQHMGSAAAHFLKRAALFSLEKYRVHGDWLNCSADDAMKAIEAVALR